MKKANINGITVHAGRDMVCIDQNSKYDPAVVFVAPENVPILVELLKAAATRTMAARNKPVAPRSGNASNVQIKD